MSKGIVIVLAVAAVATAAVLAGAPAWFEKPNESQAAQKPNPVSINRDADKVAQAYGVEREGRRLHSRYASKRERRMAEKKYLDSLAIFRSLDHAQGQTELLADLYILYLDLDEHDKAEACYEKLEHLRKKVKWPVGGNDLANMGHFYWRARAFDKAAEYYDQAVKAHEKAGDAEFAGRTLYDLGEAYRELDQYPEAAQCLERSLERSRKSGDVDTEVRALASLGAVQTLVANYAKAAEYLLKTIEITGSRGDRDLLEGVLRNLKEIYRPWSETDPENEQLKQVKLVLDRTGDKELLTRQLSLAIKEGDIQKVSALLDGGADVNACGSGGDLPLELAAEKGSMALVKLLVDRGADLQAKNDSGSRALEAAFEKAMRFEHEEVARYFLNMGAHVNAASPGERAPLQSAVNCSPDFVKMLLDKGADVNAQDVHGQTALMYAAYWGKLETTRVLLDHGALVDSKDDRGTTALFKVAEGLELLRDATSSDHLTNCFEVLKLLLKKGADVNVKEVDKKKGSITAFLRFSAMGFPEAVKLLLDKGANVNATLNDGSNALFWAMEGHLDHYHYPLRVVQSIADQKERSGAKEGLSERRCETAKLLIAQGIDVNAKLKADGSTALTWAALLGEAELVRLLLDKGAAVDARLTDDRTPLLCSATSGVGFEILKELGSRTLEKQLEQESRTGEEEPPSLEILKTLGPWSEVNEWKQRNPGPASFLNSRYVEVAKLLLDSKADVNAKLADGSTALMWASILGQADMVSLLLERGADANAKLADGSTAMDWAAVYERQDVVTLLARHGSAVPLATAAASGLKNEVQRQLDQGADVNAKDARGTTALMTCTRVGDLETTTLLLDRGADVRAKDERGWTALNESVWNNHLQLATILLDKGADPNAADNAGWTPLIQAAWKGQTEAVSLLIARGAEINTRDTFGKTAFMRAVEMGHRDVASLLLDKGTDVNAAQADGWTPVMAAVTRQDREMVAFLRKSGAAMTVAAAVLLGDGKEMQRLVQEAVTKRAQIGDAPMALLIATRDGREDMVTFLLDRCPDIDIKGTCCDTALIFAIGKRHTGIAKALLKKGANVNAADDWKKTALHHAASVDDFDLVRMLVEKGADVDASTVDGTAPLAYALGRNPNVKIVKFLLEKGASVNAASNFDFTAEVVKSGNKEVLELLKAHGLELPH
jgi:ankyrin repeat protein